jgi:hypothetical protein
LFNKTRSPEQDEHRLADVQELHPNLQNVQFPFSKKKPFLHFRHVPKFDSRHADDEMHLLSVNINPSKHESQVVLF